MKPHLVHKFGQILCIILDNVFLMISKFLKVPWGGREKYIFFYGSRQRPDKGSVFWARVIIHISDILISLTPLNLAIAAWLEVSVVPPMSLIVG